MYFFLEYFKGTEKSFFFFEKKKKNFKRKLKEDLKKGFIILKNTFEKGIKFFFKKKMSMEKHTKGFFFTQSINLWPHY